MANPKTPITELDFDSIKTQLRTYLQTQTQFKDYNFEGSNMSVLLDVLAFNTFQNSFYTNMAINEMFLDSAVIKNSIVSHAKELNYVPRSRKSATALVRVTINAPDEVASTLTIPKFSNFSSSFQGDAFNFVTNQTYVARRVSPGVYVADNVKIFEGQMLQSFEREGFIVDSDGTLRVRLSNNQVDTDSIIVFVDAEATEDQNVFTRASSIYGVRPLDRVFYLEAFMDDSYAIYFGKNEFGLQPEEFEDVRVKYRICSGSDANGANSFSANFIEDATISVETLDPAAGGQERESMESIRFFAPKALQIQERAVTKSDYEILLKQRFPEIKAVAAYGGEELDPPQFGKVAISIFLDGNTQLISNTLANAYVSFLSEKSPLGIEPIFVQTKFMYADIQVDAVYTSKNTEKSADQLEALIREAIKDYSVENLEDFNRTLRRSKLSSIIDGVDDAIQSSSLAIMPIIEFSPAVNVRTAPSFRFEAELIKPYPFRLSNGFTDYKPAIISSPFDVDGECVYLQDDGMGKIMLVTDDLTNPQIINPKAGVVDYETGEVKLSNFIVEDYVGNAIKIMARIKNSDVNSPQGRVFIIRDTDVKVNMRLAERIPSSITSSSTIGTL